MKQETYWLYRDYQKKWQAKKAQEEEQKDMITGFTIALIIAGVIILILGVL